MEKNLEYKAYYGSVEYSKDDDILFGKIIGINDLVTYEADSVTDLKAAFKESVDDYLETCKAMGKEPNRSYKGTFNIRLPETAHRELSLLAEKNNLKLNQAINKAVNFLIKNPEKILQP